MRVGVAAEEAALDAAVSARFGRCARFVIVETDTMSFEEVMNPARDLPGGAGPAAVQTLADRRVEVAIAGEFGPKAQRALDVAGIRGITASGSIRDAVARVRGAAPA
jgi:predicted Fe-Mo cluster-binding NifX family protein